jgi:hypothetical protein
LQGQSSSLLTAAFALWLAGGLGVPSSNLGAPTNKIKDLAGKSTAKSSQEIKLERPWEGQNDAPLSRPRSRAIGLVAAATIGGLMHELAAIRSHADLIEALRRRAVELDLSHIGADALAGLPAGYTSKLLCGMKGLGDISLPALLDALGVKLVLIEDPAATEASRRARARLGIGRRDNKKARPRVEPWPASPSSM